ncbi:MAG: hypothetical protein ACI9J4_001498 [Paraglaciecola sp.]|jgi:hypothetical protein
MLNKKILAVAVAAAFSFNASAAVNLNTGVGAVTYAQETIADAGTIVTTTVLNASVDTGFNLPQNAAGTPYYIRFELGNATFLTNALVSTSLTTATGGAKTIALAAGGTVGDSYAVFTYVNTDTTSASADEFTLSLDTTSLTNLKVTSASSPVNLTYKLFQNADGVAALNTGVGASVTTTFNIASFVTGQINTAVANNNTALVANGFKTFKDTTVIANTDAANAVVGSLFLAKGAVTILSADDSVAVDLTDVYTTSTAATATIAGNFSYGTWTVETTAACGGVSSAVTLAEDKLSGTVAVADYSTAAKYLCVATDGIEVIPRVPSAYSLTLVGAKNTGITGTFGTIDYDTTSIKIDYITINPAYAQKIFLVNTSGTAASYTTSFTLEDGSTATGGTGTVAANKMVTLKADEFMIVTGAALRGSAVIEIEGNSTDIQATTQIIDEANKTTDTITLSVQ